VRKNQNISPIKFIIGHTKGWKKTHVQPEGIVGASLCRWVTMTDMDWRREMNKDEEPTCIPCKQRMQEIRWLNRETDKWPEKK
jgi:hypothetical protein